MQAQTEYHELVLYPSRLHVVNRVSQLLVQEVPLTARGLGIGVAPHPLGFVEDVATGTLFIYMGRRRYNLDFAFLTCRRESTRCPHIRG